MIGISRERPADTIAHLRADLADPSTWSMAGASFRRELDGFAGEHVAFIHAAGTNNTIDFAGEVDSDAYLRNVVINTAARRFSVSISLLLSSQWMPAAF